MLKILDVSSQRLIKMLNLLLNAEGWLTIKNIATELQTSEKTIVEDIKRIKLYWESKIGLETSCYEEIRPTKLSVNNLIDIQSSILSDAVPIKLIESVFYCPNKDLNFHAEKLHVARSTLYRYIAKINEFLAQFGIVINSQHSLYNINGPDELVVRSFCSIFFLELSGYSFKMFMTEKEAAFFASRIERQFEHNGQRAPGLQVTFYSVFYFVSLIREEQHFILDSTDNFVGRYLKLQPEDHFFLEKQGKRFSEETVKKIETSFLCFHTPFNKVTDEVIDRFLPLYMTRFFEMFNLSIKRAEYELLLSYLNNIYIHEKLTGVPFHLTNSRFSYFAHQAKVNNLGVYQRIEALLDELSERTSINFSRQIDIIAYVLIMTLPEIIQVKFDQKILIISDHSKKHAEFLFNVIQTQLNIAPSYFSQVVCISSTRIEEFDLAEFQIIMTNSFLVNQEYKSFLINDYPSDQNIKELKQFFLAANK